MPNVKVKVYDTQNNSWMFDQDVDVDTYDDIKGLIGHDSRHRYTDRETREDPFTSTGRRVTGDVTIFCSPAKSKAGKSHMFHRLIK